ncbi:MAG: tetratricopeptide repeat protein, partial [Leptolyngbyaceae cyanobacterium SL_7_1]|nr:tetratricopeptide repeat protein [Leptolyngbyaceae cyanobacterium SL_7_1]
LHESIGDVQGKAATLHQLAGIYAQQGQVEQAIDLYQQSLAAEESIGNVQGKAATLANLAYLAGQQGDTTKQLQFNLQAAASLAQIKAYPNLVTVLSNLGATPSEQQSAYLAQAIWLSLRIQMPFVNVFTLIRVLFNQVPQADPLEPLLATTALFLCQQRGEAHPQLNDLQTTSLKMLVAAAAAQGIQLDDMEALGNWMEQQQLNDPQIFLPQLMQQLETLVGDAWVFDPSLL